MLVINVFLFFFREINLQVFVMSFGINKYVEKVQNMKLLRIIFQMQEIKQHTIMRK